MGKNNKPQQPLTEMTTEELVAMVQELQASNEALGNEKAEAVKAYQELLDEHNELKQNYESLMDGNDTPADKVAPAAKGPAIPLDSFEANGSSYKMAIPSLMLKGIGKRTALEILTDDEAYEVLGGKTIRQHLVDTNSIAVVKA